MNGQCHSPWRNYCQPPFFWALGAGILFQNIYQATNFDANIAFMNLRTDNTSVMPKYVTALPWKWIVYSMDCTSQIIHPQRHRGTKLCSVAVLRVYTVCSEVGKQIASVCNLLPFIQHSTDCLGANYKKTLPSISFKEGKWYIDM